MTEKCPMEGVLKLKYAIKMIVLDLDGTLLRSDKTISERTKITLGQCRNIGIKVVYATVRGGSVDHVAPAEFFDGRITMAGAAARVGEEIIYQRLIPWQVARTVLVACAMRGLKTGAESGGVLYSNLDDFHYSVQFERVDFSKYDKDSEMLFMILRNEEDTAFINMLLADSHDDLHMVISRDKEAMIMHKEATKSRAVESLAKYWGIVPNEIVAFGDDLIDVELLNFVGTGVAMENALDEVKFVSNCQCPSNDEDGVAQWLEEYILTQSRISTES